MEDRMVYKLLRVQKEIKICDMEKYVGCTHALISMYERNKSEMSEDKIRRYKEYIDNFNEGDK